MKESEPYKYEGLKLSKTVSEEQMKQTTKTEIDRLLNSSEFANMAKNKGLSTEAYQ